MREIKKIYYIYNMYICIYLGTPAVRWTALILKHSCTRSKGECTYKQKPQESTVHCTQCTAWINYLYRPQSIGLLLFKIVLRKYLASNLLPVNVSDTGNALTYESIG